MCVCVDCDGDLYCIEMSKRAAEESESSSSSSSKRQRTDDGSTAVAASPAELVDPVFFTAGSLMGGCYREISRFAIR